MLNKIFKVLIVMLSVGFANAQVKYKIIEHSKSYYEFDFGKSAFESKIYVSEERLQPIVKIIDEVVNSKKPKGKDIIKKQIGRYTIVRNRHQTWIETDGRYTMRPEYQVQSLYRPYWVYYPYLSLY